MSSLFYTSYTLIRLQGFLIYKLKKLIMNQMRRDSVLGTDKAQWRQEPAHTENKIR